MRAFPNPVFQGFQPLKASSKVPVTPLALPYEVMITTSERLKNADFEGEETPSVMFAILILWRRLRCSTSFLTDGREARSSDGIAHSKHFSSPTPNPAHRG